MQVKVCGLTTAGQVETCVSYGANFCGFILNYKKSHRFVDYDTAEELTRINKKNSSYVGVLVNPSKDELKKFSKLNLDYFQIYGDYSDEKIGKPTGIDIKEQKMTLPLIHTLNTCSEKDKAWIINSVKKHNKDKKRVKEVITFVKENGRIDYTISKMNDYKNRALSILENYPSSAYKDSLIQMIDYVVERKI